MRGPSSGGSGQDNIYLFDGVNVTRPLFGSLSAEPSSHDIEQVTTIKGGARAINFDRSGGFTIDTVSKSGSSRLVGELSYKFQNAGMSAASRAADLAVRAEQDLDHRRRRWPKSPSKAFFYGSYYRPEITRENRANSYGPLPQFERERNEYFGKLTLTPIRDVPMNVSHRNSKRNDTSSLFGPNSAATTGSGEETTHNVTIARVVGHRAAQLCDQVHALRERDPGHAGLPFARYGVSADRLEVGYLESDYAGPAQRAGSSRRRRRV